MTKPSSRVGRSAPTRRDCAKMSLTCACYNLRRASRIVTQLFDEHFDEVGLKATQFTALAAVGWYEERSPTVGELAETLLLEQSSLSRNLAVLERERLVRLVPGKRDRRERRVVLTPVGRLALERGYPVWERVQSALATTFGEGELDVHLRSLRSLTEVAQRLRAARSGSGGREPAGAAPGDGA